MIDRNASFCEQILNISMTKVETILNPDSFQTEDLIQNIEKTTLQRLTC